MSKKGLVVCVVLGTIFVGAAVVADNRGVATNNTGSQTSSGLIQQALPAHTTGPSAPAANPVPADDLSNDNYYTNSTGLKVHSPAYSDTQPTGATARCRDGTYSFSMSRRGTCSHHGGVGQWLY
jgi:transcription elongation factor